MVTELLSIDFGAGEHGAENPTGEFFAGLENRALVSIVQRYGSCAVDDLAGEFTAGQSGPLVLHGPVYSGKTHLAHGIAARWRAQRPSARVCVIAGSDYAREFAQACRADSVDAFGQRYRNCDLLVLDALDEMANKIGAQEHLCRTLDVLEQRDGKCIITLRMSPSRMRGVVSTLTSRLSAGLCVSVALPAETTRSQLVMLFAKRRGLSLDEECCQLLAQRLPAGVLPVSNAVAQLAVDEAGGKSREEVTRWLDTLDRPAPLELKTIAAVVAKLCGTTVGEMKSPSRRKMHVQARGLAMLAARKFTPLSLAAIGNQLGGRDHTTVMHACQTMERRLQSDQTLLVLWEELLATLQEQRCSDK